MTREQIEALAMAQGMLGQMATTNLLVRFAELVAAEKPAANVQLLEALSAIRGIASHGLSEHETSWVVVENIANNAITSAEHQQEEPAPWLTDEEIDACRRPGLIDSLLDPYDQDKSGNECSSMYIDLRKFARAVIAADRAKRGG